MKQIKQYDRFLVHLGEQLERGKISPEIAHARLAAYRLGDQIAPVSDMTRPSPVTGPAT